MILYPLIDITQGDVVQHPNLTSFNPSPRTKKRHSFHVYSWDISITEPSHQQNTTLELHGYLMKTNTKMIPNVIESKFSANELVKTILFDTAYIDSQA